MIPGLSDAADARLDDILQARITSLTRDDLVDMPMIMLAATDRETASLGIHASGHPDLAVIITDPDRKIGQLRINAEAPGCVLFVDNREAAGQLFGTIRMLGAGAAALFPAIGDSYIALHDVFLRSPGQLLFWGQGATAVGCSIEMEGAGKLVAIGDDALLSAGIWIRNHDMHAVHDLSSGRRINRDPIDVVLERHVWLGQNAMLHGTPLIGAGAIVGAQALVKNVVGRCVAVGGVPARVIRSNVSWGRDLAGITRKERDLLAALPPA
jgi:acetyltransferase-like isoleucine patch superfamily enzyme